MLQVRVGARHQVPIAGVAIALAVERCHSAEADVEALGLPLQVVDHLAAGRRHFWNVTAGIYRYVRGMIFSDLLLQRGCGLKHYGLWRWPVIYGGGGLWLGRQPWSWRRSGGISCTPACCSAPLAYGLNLLECLGWCLQTVGLVPDEGLQTVLPGWRASLRLDCRCVLLGRRQGGLAQSSSTCWQWRA
jgi:hypothetical protein